MPRVTMPQLGETVVDGTVTRWYKRAGETVARGEALFEVSTDKVDTEIPAPADGVLTSILVAEGETVDVGTILAIIDEDVEKSATDESRVRAGAPTGRPALPPSTSPATPPPVSPVVRRLLGEHHLRVDDVKGTGPMGRVTRDDVLAHVAAPNAPDNPSTVPCSPVVRKLLREHGIDPRAIKGTGPDGRLLRRDVEAHLGLGNAAPIDAGASDEIVPFTKIRRLTAEHMTRSKTTAAHTLIAREADYEHVESVRRRFGDAFKSAEGFTLTYLPFSALATLEALRDYPHLSASVGDDALIVHRDVSLGVAVDLDGNGLVVPVIHHAASYGLRSIARRVRELAVAARAKKLTVDDTAGGTFTITNPGPFGTLLTGAIINQPQVAILATDGVTRKPVVVTGPQGEEGIAIHSMGTLALTFDHRVIDGAYAAQFLRRVAEILQTRDWASEF